MRNLKLVHSECNDLSFIAIAFIASSYHSMLLRYIKSKSVQFMDTLWFNVTRLKILINIQ